MDREFVIYRIIGSGVPPRHDREESVRNLAFILDREPELPGCEKRWLLNCIADPEQESRCLEMITGRGYACHRMPFDPAPFRAAFYDASGMPEEYNPLAAQGGRGDPLELPVLAYEWLLRWKSLALVNINAARNRALDLGQADGHWTLPLDGETFFTLAAWQALVAALHARPDVLYALIPTARLADNALLDTPQLLPPAADEAQIAFRHDAPDRFDERRRYGNQNKVDLLQRLGLPGPWHRWAPATWDTMAPLATHARGSYVVSSRVYRLASGASEEVEASGKTRHLARFRGIGRLAARIDRKLLAGDHAGGGVEHGVMRAGLNAPGARDLVTLTALADDLLSGPLPVMGGRTGSAAGAGSQDYVSARRYVAGPDAHRPAIDGRTRPDAVIGSPESKAWDRTTLWQAVHRTCVFTAAGIHGGNPACLDRAARLVETWFVDPATAMVPDARFAQHEPGRPGWANPAGWIDFRDFWLLPALCRSLVIGRALPLPSRDAARAWAGRLNDALTGTRQGRLAHRSRNNIGTWMHLLQASLGLWLGRYKDASRLFGLAPVRLAMQCGPDGAQALELDRKRPLHYSLFNITAWALLAGLARSNRVDLWRYRGVEGQSICRMLGYVIGKRDDFAEAQTQPEHWAAWIDALCLLVPEDAADRDLLPSRRNQGNRTWQDQPDWGLPPQWHLFLIPSPVSQAKC